MAQEEHPGRLTDSGNHGETVQEEDTMTTTTTRTLTPSKAKEARQDIRAAWAKVANAREFLDATVDTTGLHTAGLALTAAHESLAHADLMDASHALLVWMMETRLDRSVAGHRLAMEGCGYALGLTLKVEDTLLGLR